MMHCPKCGGEAGVKDMRENTAKAVRTNGIQRRRDCLACGHKFKTWEYIDPALLEEIERRKSV